MESQKRKYLQNFVENTHSQVLKRKAPLNQVKYWLKGEDAKKTKTHAVGAGENIWMVG